MSVRRSAKKLYKENDMTTEMRGFRALGFRVGRIAVFGVLRFKVSENP